MSIISIEVMKAIDERGKCDEGVLYWDEVIAKCN